MAGFLVKLAIKKAQSKMAEKGASKAGGDKGGGGMDLSGIGGGGLGSSIARDFAQNRLSKRSTKRAAKYND